MATDTSAGDSGDIAFPLRGVGAKLDQRLTAAIRRVTESAVAPYQSAVVRIGFALTFTLFLIREWPNRLDLYGTTSPWSFDIAKRLIATNNAFSILMWSNSRVWVELVYHGVIVAGVLLLVGWRTRTMSVLFMVGVLAIQNRSVFMGDGGDNVIHLMSLYLVLTRCGQVWSLDARRMRRDAEGERTDRVGVVLWLVIGATLFSAQVSGFAELRWVDPVGPLYLPSWGLGFWGLWAFHGLWWWAERYRSPEPRALLNVFGNLLHNGAMLVIVTEVCLIYATAGWYKIQGSRWEDGTALYYPLNLDYFNPWPLLSQALGAIGVMIMVISYGTVMVQVAFPFTLFNRRVKNVLLALMMVEHAAIAVTLGLPFFSLAMIAADAVFLPTNLLQWLGGRVSTWRRSMAVEDSAALDRPEPRGVGQDAPSTSQNAGTEEAKGPDEAPPGIPAARDNSRNVAM